MTNRLWRGNALLAALHAAQAAVILVLSTGFSLPVTGAFMEGPLSAPGQRCSAFFDVLPDSPVEVFVAEADRHSVFRVESG